MPPCSAWTLVLPFRQWPCLHRDVPSNVPTLQTTPGVWSLSPSSRATEQSMTPGRNRAHEAHPSPIILPADGVITSAMPQESIPTLMPTVLSSLPVEDSACCLGHSHVAQDERPLPSSPCPCSLAPFTILTPSAYTLPLPVV